jgi:hypothetical protein
VRPEAADGARADAEDTSRALFLEEGVQILDFLEDAVVLALGAAEAAAAAVRQVDGEVASQFLGELRVALA